MAQEENVMNEKNMQLHYKRVGREFAMQFLFQVDVVDVEDRAKALEIFWMQVEDSDILPMNRIYRKGREFAENIIEGVSANVQVIDEAIEEASNSWKIDRMVVVDKNLMRIAVFEMMFCEDVPAPVSIDEAIEIAKDFSDEKSAKFINGILNKIKETIEAS